MLELLPIIGPIISMIPTLLVALTTRRSGPSRPSPCSSSTSSSSSSRTTCSCPKIQGDAVELHPSLVIFALIIGGSIAGLLGAILAIPITAAAMQVYRYLFNRLGEEEVEALPPVDGQLALPLDPAPAEDSTETTSAAEATSSQDSRAPQRP